MKKFITVLLAMVMVLALVACGGEEKEETTEDAKTNKVGGIESFDNAIKEHFSEAHSDVMESANDLSNEIVVYPTLSAAQDALDKGEINMLAIGQSTADYMVAHNDKYVCVEMFKERVKTDVFSMITSDTNTELHGILDSGIKQLKEEGTLESLIEEEIKAYTENEPKPVELPHFEGSKTYKIAVTGEIPPMDFETADGEAAGFNMAILAEIANIAEVNFELVQVDKGKLTSSLTSGKADAAFWKLSYVCPLCGETLGGTPEGTLVTEDYFKDYTAFIKLKDE